jgi:dsDNA-specific endonuclease/ATPase MutS2
LQLQDAFQNRDRISQSNKISKPHIANDPTKMMEVDLHIEELLDDYSGMSNFEIVQVQLKAFQNALDKAIEQHIRSLTVIHGIGTGRLKQEIIQVLNTSYPKIRYRDASYSKYGMGATEVVLY